MSETEEPDYLRRREESERKQQERETSERGSRERNKYFASLKALIRQIGSYQSRQERSDEKRLHIDQIAALASLLAVIVSGASLVAFWVLTSKADKTAAEALAISKNQLREMHDEARPWVGIGAPKVEVSVGQMGTVIIPVFNFGHSPALQMFAQFWEFNDSGVGENCPATSDGTQEPRVVKAVLFPDQVDYVTLNLTDNYVQQDYIDFLKRGVCIIKIAGRIDYLDSEKAPHYTTVRATYSPGGDGFVPDATGNDAN
jgi:hypothetical protein